MDQDNDDDNDSLDVARRLSPDQAALHSKINRAYLGLELRITIDHLLNQAGARLVNRQGRSIDVHPDTAQKYQELQSLIHDYIKEFGTDPNIEEIKNKWAVLTRKVDYKSN